MSWIRTTLDSVTKAVSSTDLISKFSRFKPASVTVAGNHAEKAQKETSASSNSAASTAQITMKEDGEGKDPDGQRQQVADGSSGVAKQTMQLFHPVALSTNMDETSRTLAQHINSYFGTSAHGGEEEGDAPTTPHRRRDDPAAEPVDQTVSQTSGEPIPVLSPVTKDQSIKASTSALSPPLSENSSSPPSEASQIQASEVAAQSIPEPPPATKKGFTHYLSYPRPSVQAFVGSYITPLVPKFRGEAKSVASERDKAAAVPTGEPASEKTAEKQESEEEKAKRKLLLQREKIIARVSIDNRTRVLVKGLERVNDVKLLTSRVEELSRHLLEFPETGGVAIKERVLPRLLRLRQARDLPLRAAVREALALVGYTDPVKGRGIRILAIDGGGTRGLLALQTLHRLQNLTGKRIHQLFDYICGVSTGAILAFMLGIFQIPLEECEQMYRKLGADVFKQNVIVGTVKMGWSHAFYDSEIWENILRERMGEGHMIESARDPNSPKVSAVSAIVNRGLPLKAYVFRNYRLTPGVRSHYLGDCKYKMWQAIRASSAAPGYFQEFVLGKDLHQDGGLLINNPTALAIHECKCLWPNTPLQCVLSLGTGRYETAGKNGTTSTSLKAKLTNIISSATDTEEVHTMLDALLPPDTYFRFNPYMSEDIPLHESRAEKLNFLKAEGERYLERNEYKLRKAASVLGREKSKVQRVAEWAKLKADMYKGLPLISKL
ncbi:calcium-independent phospholipase A2-gamma [Takifugu rubripes]|uniref:calcium-independent phospholipase A2-gamma n=1 Tax=Takifugu rubripes TaxID=31033 RepID=UPI0011456770|nr:calcium-independent phospholipase A2-gamma [Takifugu rubripes]